MKVLSKEGKDNLTVKSELGGAKVLRKLILKAEKRKSYAENFHIYAVLQSTIRRLKLDTKSLKVIRNCKFGNSEDKGMNQNSRSITCVQNSVINIYDIHDHDDDKDPLNLNTFFEELNSR
jgi:hypothetical protein